MDKISIIIPVFNEDKSIQLLYNRLKIVLKENNIQADIIFINDGSSDNSLEVLKEISEIDPRVKILNLSRNFGHQAALTAGIDYSNGKAIICMDGDLQHPPEIIPELIEKWREGYDIVYTIRKETKKISIAKHLSAEVFYKLFNLLSPIKIIQNTADFRLISCKQV